MIRAALPVAIIAAAMGAIGCGVAVADAASPQARTAIGPAPWAEVAISPIFDPDDAYVFGDVVHSRRLDGDAAAAAALIDRELMDGDDDETESWAGGSASLGRVAGAFASFTNFGAEGEAYASVGLARAGGTTIRIARAVNPSPFAVAVALSDN
ncbi:MAG: hypothetical protein DI565_07565 [Ancylobacter novellus]|uniref:Uncharacterized protein n=1 Tax=Ancylobacter novellus TaxID=921 RepID=A0A2W5KJD7_ANCNO|nr:MAG: hypothetical protein DI565_07565 [Ancylobacter novellus]